MILEDPLWVTVCTNTKEETLFGRAMLKSHLGLGKRSRFINRQVSPRGSPGYTQKSDSLSGKMSHSKAETILIHERNLLNISGQQQIPPARPEF